jgi:hypothetical protein
MPQALTMTLAQQTEPRLPTRKPEADDLVWTMVYLMLALSLITAGIIGLVRVRRWMKDEGLLR